MRRAKLGNAAHGLVGVSRRRWVSAALAAVAAGAVAAAVLVGLGAPAPGRAAGQAAGPSGVATVQSRNLVSTDTESGTLGYANPRSVFDRLSGTITWLASVGQVIRPGQALYEVDGTPVVLMDGSFPAYRDLGPGVSDGRDVLELNRNLVKLGFSDGEITIDDAWQPGTTGAVERWQASLGEAKTGTISLGQVVFLPGAQQIAQVNAALGSSAAGASGGSGSSGAASSSSGSAGDAASATLETTSTRVIVTVHLDASKQREAVLGEPVTVQLPDGSTVEGRITGISPVARSGGGSAAASGAGSASPGAATETIPVTIALARSERARGLDQAAVSVNFEQAVARNVLSVPVTALLARAGGGYAVQQAAAPHRLIPVTTGLFAAGYVQVIGAGLYPGLQVTDSQG